MENLEKPKRPDPVSKKIDELKVDSFFEKLRMYNMALTEYEQNEYEQYVEISKALEEGRITYDEYLDQISDCLNLDYALREIYKELLKDLDEIDESYLISGEYNLASEEELKAFEESIRKYEEELKKYQELKIKIDKLKEELEKETITEEEYNKELEYFKNFEKELIAKQKQLEKVKRTVYNRTVITKLNNYKRILESTLHDNELTEGQRK